MREQASFDYAIVRVVPHVERGECLNAGVILLCRERGYLAARTALDVARLRGLAPDVGAERIRELRAHLKAIARIASGAPDAGPIARLSQAERFHWLTAPRSTSVQISAVHSGMTDSPSSELAHLFATMVRAPTDTTRAMRPRGAPRAEQPEREGAES